MLISTVHIKKRRAVLIYLVMPGTLLVMSLISCGLRTGDDVLIPVGFTGWVEIRYNEPESPPLERSGLKPLINVPPSGRVSTSSSRSLGYGADRYYFVVQDGTRTRIQDDSHACADDVPCVQQFKYYVSPRPVTVFFVGKTRDIGNYKRPDNQ